MALFFGALFGVACVSRGVICEICFRGVTGELVGIVLCLFFDESYQKFL